MDSVTGGAGSSTTTSSSAPPPLPPFLCKTYDMVDDPSTNDVVSWSNTSNSFVVWNVPEFSKRILPKHFKHSNFSSFVRQLNTYGFRKVDPDRWEFANEGFLRGNKQLLNTINRRKQPSVSVPNSTVKSSVEVGNSGLVEEVGKLKRDKNVLMQELVRLRQQQQSTEHHLGNVGQRVHVMEQRLQQMMSFLANAMQSPGFMAQLVNQPSESNRKLSSGTKKRRLPDFEKGKNYSIPSEDGQIVKYQPLMNEAAKSMLRKIMNMDTSGRPEAQANNPNGFLFDESHMTSSVLDSGSSSDTVSGVTLAELLPSMAAQAEVQSSYGSALGKIPDTMFPEAKTATPAFGEAPRSISEKNVDIPNVRCQGPATSDVATGAVHDPIAIASEKLLADDDTDVLLDEVSKLPGINDVFWEQFLSGSPLTGDTDDINTGILGRGIGNDEQVNQEGEQIKMKNLNSLTEQMSLLESAARIARF